MVNCYVPKKSLYRRFCRMESCSKAKRSDSIFIADFIRQLHEIKLRAVVLLF